jgi:hypothetical protein
VSGLDHLEGQIVDMRVPVSFSNSAYALRSHVTIVRARIKQEDT